MKQAGQATGRPIMKPTSQHQTGRTADRQVNNEADRANKQTEMPKQANKVNKKTGENKG
jgi:hypothetical protein